MVMILQMIATLGCYGLQLMIRQVWHHPPGSLTGTIEEIIGIVHLVTAEDGLQTVLIEVFVMRHQGKSFNHRRHLLPYLREDRGIIRIHVSQAVNPCIPIVVVIRLRLDQGLEGVDNLSTANDNYTDAADACHLPIGRLEIYRCEIS